MKKITLKAEPRRLVGRKVKRLRKEGILPANVYGRNIKSVSLQVDQKEFQKVFKEVGETGLVELVVGTKKKPILIHSTQLDPISNSVIHADFLQVDLKKKVTVDIPVEIVGESPADKAGLGILVQHINEIEVEALPANLPDKFEIDVSGLDEVDKFVSVSDLKVDTKKIEIKAGKDQIIAKVEQLSKEEDESALAAEEGAEETEGNVDEEKDKKDEGEKPSEQVNKEKPQEVKK